ncbi:mesoderm posterior protein 1-like [Dunckerocampus dactyliophorus]|uniref:mesoderm posterior protein 1-like n=1 Tax=Dunckerocampus dactyliophorus TaxID=161453 RepID=UPI002404A244|nr:mesoderm posterior protein 1-like [Dunckerocampus dactyliophorus]
MDASPVLNYGLQYQWFSDSDLSGISSPDTLSPVHSMDSSLSPSYQQPPRSAPEATESGYSPTIKASSRSESGRKTGRAARTRSKQRESASEKEKLRMRDLTKALHHLRSYLPPSVAPTGQTLTKIETLRLAIRYISFLSAQLGLSEEVLFQRREQGDASASDASSPDILAYFQRGPPAVQSSPLQGQNLNQNQGLYSPGVQPGVLHSGNCSHGLTSAPEREPMLPPGSSSQMYTTDCCSPLVPRHYWA